ncbi:MAG TPA: sugar phosphate isomerase/epimerase family protein, partial [bacterium]|nr:sugar phosphate isomerase/epimerase family protein [bacterium]
NLDDEDIDAIQKFLDKYGIKISAIASPIGKVRAREDIEGQKEKLRNAIKLAHIFNTPYIRIFSFYPEEGMSIEELRKISLERLGELVRIAEKEGVILLHENEKRIYGDIPERCLDILKNINSPNLKAVFDPSNFIQCNVKPFREAYPLLEEYIEYIHIKDANFSDGVEVPAGEGDGEIKEILKAIKGKGREFFLSLEPHLAHSGQFQGFSGPELFKKASQALKKILSEIER